MEEVHSSPGSGQIFNDWYVHWDADELTVLKEPVGHVFPLIASVIDSQLNAPQGSRFQNSILMVLWNRLRLFNSFQSTLSDYWRGVADPFVNRDYARFGMSLPRAALDGRRLLADVFRRYYGRLAVVPGTYASQPLILTGRYLLEHRVAEHLPAFLRRGPFAGFDDVPLRMDIDCIQAVGKKALWPLFEAKAPLSEWVDFSVLERDFQTIMHSREDIRPLRRLQVVQTLAYRLLGSQVWKVAS